MKEVDKKKNLKFISNMVLIFVTMALYLSGGIYLAARHWNMTSREVWHDPISWYIGITMTVGLFIAYWWIGRQQK